MKKFYNIAGGTHNFNTIFTVKPLMISYYVINCGNVEIWYSK